MFFHVSVSGTHVDDGRGPSSVTGRESAFVKVHILDDIRIECREQPSQVIDLINGSSVKQKQIFIIPASVNV